MRCGWGGLGCGGSPPGAYPVATPVVHFCRLPRDRLWRVKQPWGPTGVAIEVGAGGAPTTAGRAPPFFNGCARAPLGRARRYRSVQNKSKNPGNPLWVGAPPASSCTRPRWRPFPGSAAPVSRRFWRFWAHRGRAFVRSRGGPHPHVGGPRGVVGAPPAPIQSRPLWCIFAAFPAPVCGG